MAKHLENLHAPARLAIGTLLSAALAVLVSMLFARSTWRGVLPLAFVAVLILLSQRFGVAVSVTGSITAAIIFSLMLFTPIGSAAVESEAARTNLGWMVIGSVVISYLLYPGPSEEKPQRRDHR